MLDREKSRNEQLLLAKDQRSIIDWMHTLSVVASGSRRGRGYGTSSVFYRTLQA